MKKNRSIRKIDNLGRIVIPMDIRKALEIRDWDELAITLENDAIVVKKANESCTFCQAEDDLISFEGKSLCRTCLSRLQTPQL